MRQIEKLPEPQTSVKQLVADVRLSSFSNAVIGFSFAASGPVAVILAVGSKGGLAESQLSSWIFAAFFLNGLLSIAACWLYRTPLVFFWTIPGTVLVGSALTHLSFAEVVGAFYLTGLLMLLLGLSGWIKRIMESIPMPIVMAMVAGVFLQFGIDWIKSVRSDFLTAGSMTICFIVLSAVPSLGRFLPPVIGALLTGVLMMWLGDRIEPPVATDAWMVFPHMIRPEFTLSAAAELVVPLAITVVAAQNGQGIAVLRNSGHRAPINFVTTACGLFSMLVALFGSSSTCLTGPTNALISSSGPRNSHYTAGIIIGIFALLFGLFAPALTRWMVATPFEFLAALAGLAMFRVLLSAFDSAFCGRFSLGALLCFLITVSEVTILRVGAPFWGLVFGFALSWLLERDDFERSVPRP